jgi:hypothetical protein
MAATAFGIHDPLAELPVALVTVDHSARVLTCNAAGRDLLGWRDTAVPVLLPVRAQEDFETLTGLIEFVRAGGKHCGCVVAIDRGGKATPVRLTAALSSVHADQILALQDLKANTSRLRHDAANHLSIITGYAEIVAHRLTAGSEYQHAIKGIIKAAYGVADLLDRNF